MFVPGDLIWRGKSLNLPPWRGRRSPEFTFPLQVHWNANSYAVPWTSIPAKVQSTSAIFDHCRSWTGDKPWRVSAWQSVHVPENVTAWRRECGFHLSCGAQAHYSTFPRFKSVVLTPTGCEALRLHSVTAINLSRPQIQLPFVGKWCRVEVDIKGRINPLPFHLSGAA